MSNQPTKIVATLGICIQRTRLAGTDDRAGVNVVRLNFSHGTAEDHIERARLVRDGPHSVPAAKWPSWRICKAPRSVSASLPPARCSWTGASFDWMPRDRTGRTTSRRPGLQSRCRATSRPATCCCSTTADRAGRSRPWRRTGPPPCGRGGELSNNKGINKQGGGLTAPALTAKDMEDIAPP